MSSELRRRAEELFQRIADVAAPLREAELARSCGDDAELGQEVRGLLAALDDAGDFMNEPPAARPVIDQPLRIGQYEIIREIGEGGMGVVYEARQENPRRTVALKLIRRGYVSNAVLRRFAHEAHILGQLQHPGIAQIFEAGAAEVICPAPSASPGRGATGPGDNEPLLDARTTRSRQPFFAMELIRGLPLTRCADHAQMGTRERLELLARVCDAVHFAHANGVVHRDLKPGNILVDELGQPKILDFGVARATNSDQRTVTLRTDVGQVVGTLPYMSPEQVVGDSAQVDHRADVYALGAILYELLVGRTPHDLQERSLPEAARIIREEEPTRLSALNPKLRGDIETIAAKALEKDRQRRYASAADLAADIRRYLRDEPIRARPVSTWYQIRKFSRRHRGLVVGVSAAAVMLVAAVIVSSGFAVYALRQRDVAQQRSIEMARNAYRADVAAASAALRNKDVRLARAHLTAAPEEWRGWEWRFLQAIANHGQETLATDAGALQFLGISRDGKRLVSAAADGEMQNWDAATGRRGTAFRVRNFVHLPGAALSADGSRMLLIQANPREAVLWNTDSGQPVWRRAVGPEAYGGGFSHDDRLVILPGAAEQSVEIVAAASGELQQNVAVGGVVRFTSISRDARRARVSFDTGCTKLIDISTGRSDVELCHWRLALDADWTRCLLHSMYLRRWNLISLPDGKVLANVPEPGVAWPYTTFMDAGRGIVQVDPSGVVTVLNENLNAITQFLVTPDVSCYALTDDEQTCYTGTREGLIQRWSPRTAESPLIVRPFHAAANAGAAVSAAAGVTALIGWGNVELYDARSAALRWNRFLSRRWCTAVAIGARHVAAAESDNVVSLLDLATGEICEELAPLSDSPLVMRILDRRNQLLAGLRNGGLEIRDLGGARPRQVLAPHASPVRCIAVSADESMVATGSGLHAETRNQHGPTVGPEDNSILLWNARDWTQNRRLIGHEAAVVALAMSSDGRFLASGGLDGAIFVWDSRSGETLAALGSACVTRALAFTPDGARLAAVCEDGIVRVWDTVSFSELLTLRTDATNAFAAEFSADGATLLASGAGAAILALETDGSTVPGRFEAAWANHFLAERSHSLTKTIVEVAHHASLPASVVAAVERIAQARGDHPNILNSEALMALSGAGADLPASPTALEKIDAALRVLPDEPGLLSTHGRLLLTGDRFSDAAAQLQRARELLEARGRHPSPELWAGLALAYHGLHQPERANAAFEALRAQGRLDNELGPQFRALVEEVERTLRE